MRDINKKAKDDLPFVVFVCPKTNNNKTEIINRYSPILFLIKYRENISKKPKQKFAKAIEKVLEI